jgi:hypothetical protein
MALAMRVPVVALRKGMWWPQLEDWIECPNGAAHWRHAINAAQKLIIWQNPSRKKIVF